MISIVKQINYIINIVELNKWHTLEFDNNNLYNGIDKVVMNSMEIVAVKSIILDNNHNIGMWSWQL